MDTSVDYFDGTGTIHSFVYNGITWTNLDVPGAGSGPGQGTFAYSISQSNIVGNFVDSAGVNHGFLFDGATWTTLDAPQASSGAGLGTVPQHIVGAVIVGSYDDSSDVRHGFIATPLPQLATTLSSNALTVSWPYWNNSLTGWILQQNLDLTTTNWTPVSSESITTDGTNNCFSVTPTNGDLFFRLIH